MFILRLDDASTYMDIKKWTRIERILDEYGVKPIVGIIPNNRDEQLTKRYQFDSGFWDKARKWQEKNWSIALHGYDHVYISNSGGLHPVNEYSEFAGVSLKEQRKKIRRGLEIFVKEYIYPRIFFAPAHTFDLNTLKALKLESDIRIISDTIAHNIYKMKGFYFIPQQSGRVRKLPLKITTFCYHPNDMMEKDFVMLENFIKNNYEKFLRVDEIKLVDRKISLYDRLLRRVYFFMRKMRAFVRRH